MNLDELRRRPTSEEINAMPLRGYQGDVRIIRSITQWRDALQDLNTNKILGFDTETRPTFRKGKHNAPALIQLASERAVYIVQLGWLPFGEACAEILANPGILKVGVGIAEDMNSLAKVYPFTPASMIDLGELARANNFESHGLRTLAASLFGWRISKGSQCSNWSVRQLSPRQITYAATDAWIGREIYLRLCELGVAPPPGAS